jgi:uncharacterized protein
MKEVFLLTEDSRNERLWASLCHLSAFVGYFIPLGNIIGPLIIWLIQRQYYPLVDDQGKEALNFQISMLIYVIISAILCIVLIGIVLLIVVAVANIILIIIAAVHANNGKAYRYPFTIRFIR